MADTTWAIQKQMAEQNQLAGAGQYIRPTRRKQLQDQRTMLEHQLKIVEAALSALDAHPELEEFAEALSRAGV